MNILVTGAKGMVGTALCNNLKNIRDGKNRTRPNLAIDEIYEYDMKSTPEDLDRYCQNADFVFNLAGVNRPENPEDFMKGNFGFASRLLDTLKKHNNKATIMLSSSVQATLAGRFGNSEYGRSKKAGEELFIILDEILKGTNSMDKQKGSFALIKQFMSMDANGIIATHDLLLGTLIDAFPQNIRNYCFEADITNNELTFSYQMRSGVAQNMNACFLMKKMGIAVIDG